MNHYKVYTGPTLVQGTAAALRRAGYTVTLEGTQHVYLDTTDGAGAVLETLRAHTGPGWNLNDVQPVVQ
jgi:hypothetical protein